MYRIGLIYYPALRTIKSKAGTKICKEQISGKGYGFLVCFYLAEDKLLLHEALARLQKYDDKPET